MYAFSLCLSNKKNCNKQIAEFTKRRTLNASLKLETIVRK